MNNLVTYKIGNLAEHHKRERLFCEYLLIRLAEDLPESILKEISNQKITSATQLANILKVYFPPFQEKFSMYHKQFEQLYV